MACVEPEQRANLDVVGRQDAVTEQQPVRVAAWRDPSQFATRRPGGGAWAGLDPDRVALLDQGAGGPVRLDGEDARGALIPGKHDEQRGAVCGPVH